MRRTLCLVLLIFGVASESFGFDCAYVMGQGQLLSSLEREKVLGELNSNDSSIELAKFRRDFEKYNASIKNDYKGNRPGISVYRFDDVREIAGALFRGASKGSMVYYICFDCSEGFPSPGVEAYSDAATAPREIWVLSGYGISVDMPSNKLKWRVLFSGAAE